MTTKSKPGPPVARIRSRAKKHRVTKQKNYYYALAGAPLPSLASGCLLLRGQAFDTTKAFFPATCTPPHLRGSNHGWPRARWLLGPSRARLGDTVPWRGVGRAATYTCWGRSHFREHSGKEGATARRGWESLSMGGGRRRAMHSIPLGYLGRASRPRAARTGAHPGREPGVPPWARPPPGHAEPMPHGNGLARAGLPRVPG